MATILHLENRATRTECPLTLLLPIRLECEAPFLRYSTDFASEVLLVFAQINTGFLPTRGSFMLDFVFVAMFAIVILLTISIYLVRNKRLFQIHKRLQLFIAVTLVVTLVFFEVDVRFFTDWTTLAADSIYFDSGLVHWSLAIHLAFAVPTPFVWAYTIVQAIRKMPSIPQPCEYSAKHKRLGWISAIMMYATAVTGCLFYALAFIF